MMTEKATSTQGVLELHPRGFGFLRNPARYYLAQPGDAFVPAPLIQRHALREGMLVAGPIEAAVRGTGPRLTTVERIEDSDPSQFQRRNFDELTPIDPHRPIVLETTPDRLTTRVMDLL
ncbi:MAG: transcription termination factor Rho, partial [Gemmataceae bacterium]|nr:transcription termination factor Rho [Gemmataceae bacterium]